MSQLRELESLVKLSLVIEKAAGIDKNTVQFLTDFFFTWDGVRTSGTDV